MVSSDCWLPRPGVAEPAPPAEEYQLHSEKLLLWLLSRVLLSSKRPPTRRLFSRVQVLTASLLTKHFFAVALCLRARGDQFRSRPLPPRSHLLGTVYGACAVVSFPSPPPQVQGLSTVVTFNLLLRFPSPFLFLPVLFAATKFSPSCPECGRLSA